MLPSPNTLLSENDSDDFTIINHDTSTQNNSNKNEQYEFDIINIPSNDVNKQPQQSLQLISVKCGHIETKTDTIHNETASDSPKSNTSTPNATMEDIINLTEPLNSAPDTSNESPVSTLSEANKPLTITTNMDSNKNKYHQREYEVFIADKSVNTSCTGWFCLQWTSMQNNVKNSDFVDNVSCITSVVNNYLDQCFGTDQFHSNKSLKKI